MDTRTAIQNRMSQHAPFGVWTPVDFQDLATRDAIDQTLSRLTRAGTIRRITRGLYDMPRLNRLTGKLTNPDPKRVIDALARRDQTRMLVDGITAANDLGLSDAVPAKIVVHTDARLRSLKLGDQTLSFKPTAPSRLYWAGRPAMRVVQALQWLKPTIPQDGDRISRRLASILADPDHGPAIVADLRSGFSALPDWMQAFLRPMLDRHTLLIPTPTESP